MHHRISSRLHITTFSSMDNLYHQVLDKWDIQELEPITSRLPPHWHINRCQDRLVLRLLLEQQVHSIVLVDRNLMAHLLEEPAHSTEHHSPNGHLKCLQDLKCPLDLHHPSSRCLLAL
jgi:hypothetical protein